MKVVSKNRSVTSSTSSDRWPSLAWFLRGGLLDRIVLVISCLAIAVELMVLVLSGERPLGYIGVTLAAGGLLIGRFQRPLGLCFVVAGASFAALFSTEYVALWSVVAFALFSATVRGTRAIPAALLCGIPVYLAIVAREQWTFDSAAALVAASSCAVGAAVGSAVRAQQRYLESMKQRALDAVTAAEVAVERGIAEERLRIARDLHDAVGHEVAVVSMNLGAAEVQLRDEDDQIKAALSAARGGIQRVLQEIQQILDILRRDTSDPDTAPVADVGHLGLLVEGMRDAGTTVNTRIDELGEIDPAVSVAAFRIAQEALTNAQRYGRGAVELAIEDHGETFTVRVTNPPQAPPARPIGGSGYGLIGMRERAESVGGALQIHEDGTRFVVIADLHKHGKARP